jgi:hypothetical protein
MVFRPLQVFAKHVNKKHEKYLQLSKTIMEINDLHKVSLTFQELEHNRPWTTQEPR